MILNKKRLWQMNILNDHGLTLVEIVMAFALVALIFAGAFTVFSFVLPRWERVEEESFLVHDARMVLEVLGRDIRNTTPGDAVLDAGHEGECLYLGREGQIRYRYERQDDGSGVLYREVRTTTGDYAGEPGALLSLINTGRVFTVQGKTVEVFFELGEPAGQNPVKFTEISTQFTLRGGKQQGVN